MNAPLIPPGAYRLLRNFDYLLLGEGNATAGLNTLVSMCATLAAIAGPDAKIVTDGDDELPVGIHWLVSGSLSVAQHATFVLGPLREYQNTLSQNARIAMLKMPAAARAKKPVTVQQPPATDPSPITIAMMATARDRLLLDSLVEGEPGNYTEPASKFLKRDAFSDAVEFSRHPAIFHDGMNTKALSAQFPYSHRGHPLVDFPIAASSQAHAIQSTCHGVMDGCGLDLTFPTQIQGIATARTSSDVLAGLVGQDRDVLWIYRMLWLTDTPLRAETATMGIVCLDQVRKRYPAAMRTLAAKRLGEASVSIKVPGCRSLQNQVVKHLLKLELQLPGIARALKNIFPTLLYGLGKLMTIEKLPQGFTWSGGDVASLAIHLADRMVHAFTLIRQAEFLNLKQKFADTICQRLKERPHTDLELRRRHNRLRAGLCREVLRDLEVQGRILCLNGKWTLFQRPELSNLQHPIIDVG